MDSRRYIWKREAKCDENYPDDVFLIKGGRGLTLVREEAHEFITEEIIDLMQKYHSSKDFILEEVS